jgi:TolB protein
MKDQSEFECSHQGPLRLLLATSVAAFVVAGCGGAPDEPAADAASVEEAATELAAEVVAEAGEAVDAVSEASEYAGPEIDTSQELPIWKIPNIPESAEAYFAPDSTHIIAQVQDPEALQADEGEAGGALTHTFTDQGEEFVRINDSGQDACSYFFPDMKRLVWTSTKDNLHMPKGNWSDSKEYPQGAELYTSDLDGSNVFRLTNNEWYEAEVSISPNGEWVVFGRQIDGKMDLWRIRPDGTDEQQVTFTDDWQEGAPFYLPDNETIMFRAWSKATYGTVSPTPMTVFTIKHDGSDTKQRTFDGDMNWAPYPTPDGRHYVFVRIIEEESSNWEVFLGSLDGSPPKRLTYNASFDGFPSVSPDGTKMLFTRSGGGFMSNLYTHVMDISSLGVGPDAWTGEIPETVRPEGG